MLFNKKHKQQQQAPPNKGNGNNKPKEEKQRPETEDERWQRWARGQFYDFVFEDSGKRWRVVAQSDHLNTWVVFLRDGVGQAEVSTELLWRKLAQAQIQRHKTLSDQSQIISAFINYTAEVREELIVINKKVRSPEIQAIIESIGLEIFGPDGFPYPKKESV